MFICLAQLSMTYKMIMEIINCTRWNEVMVEEKRLCYKEIDPGGVNNMICAEVEKPRFYEVKVIVE